MFTLLNVSCGDDSTGAGESAGEGTSTTGASATSSTTNTTSSSGTNGETASGTEASETASTGAGTTTTAGTTGALTEGTTSEGTTRGGTTTETTGTVGTTTGTTTQGMTDTTEGTTEGTTTTDGCELGTEGCPCLQGGLCDGELLCVENVCASPPPESCGDGIVDDGEACDDGNEVDADGCTDQCTPTELFEVSTSLNVTCVRLSGGSVRCWGAGDLSHLGVPGTDQPIGDNEHPSVLPPIKLGGAAVQLTNGTNHACARMESGELRCWGYSNFGQHGLGHKMRIGDDEDPADAPPVMIGGDTIFVGSDQESTCAVVDGGAVRCFGYNSTGQLGYGHKNHIGDTEHPVSQAPLSLGGLATSVATGLAHGCAVLESKQVRCWGSNQSGELGLGYGVVVGDNDHPSDFPVLPFVDVEAIAAGLYHTCILQTGGVVRCFGFNSNGQLGYGHTNDLGDNDSPDGGPVNVGGAAIKIVAGGQTTCALLEGGDVRCWGYNKWGQLGLAHTEDIGDDELPVESPVISLGGKAVDIDTSGRHTCAILDDDTLRCWGYPSNGALGLGAVYLVGDDEHPADVPTVQLW